MKVIKVTPGAKLEAKDIVGDLNSLQSEVGGLITLAPYWNEFEERGIDIYCDDEGLMKDNPLLSVISVRSDLSVEYGIVGNAIFCGHDGEGNNIGLTDEQIKFVIEHLYDVTMGDKNKPGITHWAFAVLFKDLEEHAE